MNRLPAVGYAKALDYWMSTCLGFLFAALVEFTIVNTLCRRVQKLTDAPVSLLSVMNTTRIYTQTYFGT